MDGIHNLLEITRINLLIVDDLTANLQALEAALRRDDATIYTATSGDAALGLLLQHEFALAIIDVQMPGMNGFELAEFMRCTEATKAIPILFVSAGDEYLDYAFRGYESGGVDFMHKPLDIFVMKSKINIFIELYRQRKVLHDQVSALEESQRRQTEMLQQLEQTQAELNKAIQVRDNFMSIVSHELRSPLNTLKLDIYLRKMFVEKGNVDAFSLTNMQRMLDADDRQIDRLVLLIDDMLDVSRIRTGHLSVRPQRVDLKVLVEGVVERFQSQLSLAGCEVRLSIAEPLIGHWDEFRIEQVLINLLTNAMRYGNNAPIDIAVERLAQNARLSLRDYGPGIDIEDQQRIFHQFERIGKDRARGGGLGLGLYISEQIVRAHGGTITVSSESGAGATFVVELPLDIPDE
ncbi:MAG TPA: hybrid sensor histidine kinase/response regulator [Spongiibacteraceae bacterium]|nr:hybrid sensor histidine kinase/response regulator [Spongiibacteraceae bacterium]